MKTIITDTFTPRALGITLMINMLIFSSCSDFLELESPKNMISQDAVFRNKATALAALADVYSNLRNNSLLRGDIGGVHFLLGCYTDELQPVTSQEKDYKIFYNLGVQANTRAVDDLWTNAYKSIYAVNNILEGIDRSIAFLDEKTIHQLKGEALAIRGLLHFYLTNIYGDIPYVVTTDYSFNQSISKSSHSLVMQQISRDLLQAEALLDYKYPTASKSHINKAAVELLLSRVYLYQKDWQNARDYATKVISNPLYGLETDISMVFLKDNKSSIWYFMPAENGINTLEGQYFIIPATPPQNAALAQSLISSFEVSDLRRQQWVKSISDQQNTYYYPYKYKQNKNTSTSLEYSIVLRLEEAYFNLIEAANELGQEETAILYLNIIRNRAGLPSLNVLPKEQLRIAIIQERRHEFFTENGFRFFDLKRTGTLDAVMTSTKPTWKAYMNLLPLPERELLGNPNLKPQNNGY